jgi:hypothetical protein
MGKSHQSFLIKCRGNVAVSINFGSSPQVALPFTCHMVQERRGVERSMVLDHGQTMGKPWENHGKTMGFPYENQRNDEFNEFTVEKRGDSCSFFVFV